MLLEDPGRVRSHIISVVCQIQWFDFDRILVVSQKVIIRIPPVLGLKPLVYCIPARGDERFSTQKFTDSCHIVHYMGSCSLLYTCINVF